MFKRDRGKHIHSVDEIPLLRGVARTQMPGAPSLNPGETIYFDFMAHRAPARPNWWRFFITPWASHATGRLTVTDQRLVFATYRRNARLLFLTATPSDLGTVEFPLSSIRAVRFVPWWKRLAWALSFYPWFTMIDIELNSGERYRFGSLPKTVWQRTIQELATACPQLTSSPAARSSNTDH
jgi:hypothetical protein